MTLSREAFSPYSLKVSIALCTYNGGEWLPRLLESISQQSRLPDEIIICDDRSNDDTLQILRKFCEDAPFDATLKINQRRLGVTENFNNAIYCCSGDVIFLCDQDDFWLPTKIEKYMHVFESKNSVMLVGSDSELADSGLKPLGQSLFSRYRLTHRRIRCYNRAECGIKEMIRQNSFLGHCLAFRSALRSYLLPIPRYGHDYWIALGASLAGEVYFFSEPFTLYRIHAGQQCKGAVGENLAKLASASVPTSHFEEKSRIFEILLNRWLVSEVFGRCACRDVSKCLLEEKIMFFQQRELIHQAGLFRLFMIVRLLFMGTYHRVGRGWLAVFRDLIG